MNRAVRARRCRFAAAFGADIYRTYRFALLSRPREKGAPFANVVDIPARSLARDKYLVGERGEWPRGPKLWIETLESMDELRLSQRRLFLHAPPLNV